jgi:hypothetical protein
MFDGEPGTGWPSSPSCAEMNFDGSYAVIPEHMREAILNYVLHHKKPGDFLTAVICNDLRSAVFNADEDNLPLLRTYLFWFYNRCPASLVGKENFYRHLNSENL